MDAGGNVRQGAERNHGPGDRRESAGAADDGAPSAASDAEPGQRAAAWIRAARFVVRALRGEWHGIVVDPVRQLLRRGLSGLSLAFVAAFGVIFFHAIAQRPTGAVAVRILGGVTADLPLWLALLRTPVSLYVPPSIYRSGRASRSCSSPSPWPN
ncbi:hypothetical protein ACFQ0G_05165 [Streptomyces chiangmaiensis]